MKKPTIIYILAAVMAILAICLGVWAYPDVKAVISRKEPPLYSDSALISSEEFETFDEVSASRGASAYGITDEEELKEARRLGASVKLYAASPGPEENEDDPFFKITFKKGKMFYFTVTFFDVEKQSQKNEYYDKPIVFVEINYANKDKIAAEQGKYIFGSGNIAAEKFLCYMERADYDGLYALVLRNAGGAV